MMFLGKLKTFVKSKAEYILNYFSKDNEMNSAILSNNSFTLNKKDTNFITMNYTGNKAVSGAILEKIDFPIDDMNVGDTIFFNQEQDSYIWIQSDKVIIKQNVEFEGDLLIKGNLEVKKDVKVDGKVEVTGNIKADGTIEGSDIKTSSINSLNAWYEWDKLHEHPFVSGAPGAPGTTAPPLTPPP